MFDYQRVQVRMISKIESIAIFLIHQSQPSSEGGLWAL